MKRNLIRFSRHARQRFRERIGFHLDAEGEGDIVEMIQTKKMHIARKEKKGWVIECEIVYKNRHISLIYDYRANEIVTLWITHEGEKMYKLKSYTSEKLKKLWVGYLETETHLIWFPKGGGVPFMMEKAQA